MTILDYLSQGFRELTGLRPCNASAASLPASDIISQT